jgi:hypothetical protein
MAASSDEEDETTKRVVHKLMRDKKATQKLLTDLTEGLLNVQLETALKSLPAGAKILKATAYTHSVAIPQALKNVDEAGPNKVSYLTCSIVCLALPFCLPCFLVWLCALFCCY